MKYRTQLTALALLALLIPASAQESVDAKGSISGAAVDAANDFLLVRDASITGGLPALKKLVIADLVNVPGLFGSLADDGLSPLSNAEVAVTAGMTLTSAAFGKMHVCTGTSTNYTLILPSAVGNAGKIIGVRMAATLTKLVTIGCSGGQSIDGSVTRIMWAGESAILLSDGSGWVKVAGKSIPFCAEMRRVNAQQIAHGTISKVLLDTVNYENVAGMCSTENSRISVPRPGFYSVIGCLIYGSLPGESMNTQVRIDKNSANITLYAIASIATSYPVCIKPCNLFLSAGDYLEISGYQVSGSPVNLWVSDPNTLTIVEVPRW